MLSFSIVVCSYNAINRLRRTLEHLAALEFAPSLFEIILVDNNSNDGTADFASELWNEINAGVPLRVVSEKKQGLCYARKCGIYEAKGKFIVFCDDDNWLDPQYLRVANEVLENNSTIGVLGGQGIPLTDAESLPHWFCTYAEGYAVGVQAKRSGDISSRGYVWGSGAIFRRDLLLHIFSNGYDFLLSGRMGNQVAAGDDSEMCKWFLLAGYRLWYEEKMLFVHFIPKERLTLDYLDKQHEGFNASWPAMYTYDCCLRRNSLRRLWKKKPIAWLKCEFEYVLCNKNWKKKVASLSKYIGRLGSPRSY